LRHQQIPRLSDANLTVEAQDGLSPIRHWQLHRASISVAVDMLESKGASDPPGEFARQPAISTIASFS
jgi:hypothetical protein